MSENCGAEIYSRQVIDIANCELIIHGRIQQGRVLHGKADVIIHYGDHISASPGDAGRNRKIHEFINTRSPQLRERRRSEDKQQYGS